MTTPTIQSSYNVSFPQTGLYTSGQIFKSYPTVEGYKAPTIDGSLMKSPYNWTWTLPQHLIYKFFINFLEFNLFKYWMSFNSARYVSQLGSSFSISLKKKKT